MSQLAFAFGEDDRLVRLRQELLKAFGPQRDAKRRDPTGQFVRSLISARTKDRDSDEAYANLRRRFQPWDRLAQADDDTVLALIRNVTHPEDKARNLLDAARALMARHGAFDLSYLAEMPLEAALEDLQRFKGVGPKTAAATLNFSTLRRRVFVLDTHVLRIGRRIGLLAGHVDDARAHALMLERMPAAWDADDLHELHRLMKRLGQTLCPHGRPLCRQCPLAALCDTGKRFAMPASRGNGPSRIAGNPGLSRMGAPVEATSTRLSGGRGSA